MANRTAGDGATRGALTRGRGCRHGAHGAGTLCGDTLEREARRLKKGGEYSERTNST